MSVVEVKNLNKKFKQQVVIQNLSFTIEENEMVAFTGASGSGKTTLLNMIGLISEPDSGEVVLFGESVKGINSRQAMLKRRKKIGYLFQNYGVVDEETVAWNLNLALTYKKYTKKERLSRIDAVLKEFHLESLKNKKVYQLSGGEQQRVAIMRLILQDCQLILADEPTGSLDVQNRNMVIAYLKKMKERGKTVLIVTHDLQVAEQCDRMIQL